MSDWLGVPDNAEGPWECAWGGIGDAVLCIVRGVSGGYEFYTDGCKWSGCSRSNFQFRRLYTGTKEEVETGKAVVALQKKQKEMDYGGAMFHVLHFASDGQCSIVKANVVVESADSLPALHEQLTKPEPLVWHVAKNGDGNDFCVSDGHRVDPILKDNSIHWYSVTTGAVHRDLDDAKADTQAHHDSRK